MASKNQDIMLEELSGDIDEAVLKSDMSEADAIIKHIMKK